ncbi:MAG: CoA-binding protein [Vicinamibacterales bacterium]
MPFTNPSDEQLRAILSQASTIAIVGASSDPDKASHGIMQRLQSVGYRVIPVNPREVTVLGETAYASLSDIPVPVEIVIVFRRAEETPAIADEAVAIHAGTLWLQSGIASDEAAARAAAGGLTMVMDACIGATHSRLGIKRA